MATYKPQVKKSDGTLEDLNLDAATLNGNEASYYLNYNNLTNKPSIPNPINYYWANVKLSSTSSNTTFPRFGSLRSGNTVYNLAQLKTSSTPKETILHTGIKWTSSAYMPVIHFTGYAYGLQSPIEFKLGFYIYSDKVGYCGVTNMGAWKPNVYLFKETRDSVNYVAVGLEGSCYYLMLEANLQENMNNIPSSIDLTPSKWYFSTYTTTGNIPTGETAPSATCCKVPYKQILNKLGTLNFSVTNSDGTTTTSYTGENATTTFTVDLDYTKLKNKPTIPDVSNLLNKDATAYDSDRLGGVVAANYALKTDLVDNDEKVKQSSTSTESWRKVVLGKQTSSTNASAVTEQTDQTYVTPNIEVQPSTGTLAVKKLMITDTNMANHIEFKRNNWNYIVASGGTSAAFGFVAGGKSASGANTTLAIYGDKFIPGQRDNQVDMGDSSYHFKNFYIKGKLYNGSYNYTLPSKTGTFALTSDLPTVNNGTLTIQKNGTNVATFTANQNTNATANITVPTKVSELTNDSSFITNTVNNLTNYYTKTNSYTKTEVNNLINNISTFNALIVNDLPSSNISTTTIYLVSKSDSETDDFYDEYMYIDNKWEMIGNTKVDLSNYYTKTQSFSKTEVQELIDGLGNNITNLSNNLNNKVDKVNGKGLSTNDYTTTEKNKLSGITAGATKVEDSSTNGNIKINGTETNVYTLPTNVVKDSSYVHTDNNYTTTEKTKLSGIASGAEVNVQADWNVTDTSSDAYIKNKPTIPDTSNFANKQEGVFLVVGNTTGTAGTWTGSNDRITSYYDGLVINYKIGIAGASTTTLNINGLGAKTVYLRGTTKVTTHYEVGTMVLLSYNSSKGAFYTADYDANSYAYARQYKVSTNAEYPMLFSYVTTIPSSYDTNYTGKNSTIKANPSTGTITATTFNGNATSATKATQDGDGNVITETYATKEELNNNVTHIIEKNIVVGDTVQLSAEERQLFNNYPFKDIVIKINDDDLGYNLCLVYQYTNDEGFPYFGTSDADTWYFCWVDLNEYVLEYSTDSLYADGSNYAILDGDNNFTGNNTFVGQLSLQDLLIPSGSGMQVEGVLVDKTGSPGSAGQVLTSTGAGGVQWATPSSSGGGSASLPIITYNGTIEELGDYWIDITTDVYNQCVSKGGFIIKDTSGVELYFELGTKHGDAYSCVSVYRTFGSETYRFGYVSSTPAIEFYATMSNDFGSHVKLDTENTFTETQTFELPVVFNGPVADRTGTGGAVGQVLTSTGMGVEWKTPSSGGGGSIDTSNLAKTNQENYFTSAQFFNGDAVVVGNNTLLIANDSPGTNGQVLTSTGSGIKWASPSSGGGSSSSGSSGWKLVGTMIKFNVDYQVLTPSEDISNKICYVEFVDMNSEAVLGSTSNFKGRNMVNMFASLYESNKMGMLMQIICEINVDTNTFGITIVSSPVELRDYMSEFGIAINIYAMDMVN